MVTSILSIFLTQVRLVLLLQLMVKQVLLLSMMLSTKSNMKLYVMQLLTIAN
ncbi:hypothetical protein N184_32760 [Sinorhizobium sp. GL28]|nr:hypothetical protein N184_32760 [Sinorhizobium sp. GL28]